MEARSKKIDSARFLLPAASTGALLLIWHWAQSGLTNGLFPSPWDVARGIGELASKGLLLKYVSASLFRVIWSFLLATLLGIPAGLALGMSKRLGYAFNPLLQLLRPISPIAWIPLSILWFGLSEAAPMFLIFLASFLPIAVAAMSAVRHVQPMYLRVAQNFGLSPWRQVKDVVFPATLPSVLTGLRVALGVAWLVVVAAEMIVVDPRSGGLGYLINDSRSAGRYDLVVAGMLLIGVIGLILDLAIRQLEQLDAVRWGFHQAPE